MADVHLSAIMIVMLIKTVLIVDTHMVSDMGMGHLRRSISYQE